MKLFSGSSNRPLAEKVALELGIELSPVETHVFPDGERRIRITEPIADDTTVVIQSANPPVDQNYMELFFIIDALKRNKAKSIIAVLPYFGYQRQDHVFREGEAVSLEVVIKMLESVGVDRFISFDLHASNIPDLFHIPVTNLSAIPVFAQHIKSNYWKPKETLLISPDKGGLRGINIFSKSLDNADYIVLNKTRDTLTGTVTYEPIEEKLVAGKSRAIILDDMISSGSTIIPVADMLHHFGVEEVEVCATHPVFSENAPYILQNSPLSTVYVTDTVKVSSAKRFEKLYKISVASEIAKELRSLS